MQTNHERRQTTAIWKGGAMDKNTNGPFKQGQTPETEKQPSGRAETYVDWQAAALHDGGQEPEVTAVSGDEAQTQKTEINIVEIEKEPEKKRAKRKAGEQADAVNTSGKISFAAGLNFYKLFWIFFIGSFIGVVLEVIFCLLVDHRYESRSGVIYGPFNPVYGFGAVVITLALYWLRNKRDVWVFICGGIIGAAFEYVCSWYQETFLGTVSWDYSGSFLNIGGRTNLMYALFWGLLSIGWLKFIYPFMSRMIEKIPNWLGRGLTWVLVIFMALNCLISAAAVNRMSARYEGVPARSGFDMFLDQAYPDEFLTQIYTHMAYSDGTGTDQKVKEKASEDGKKDASASSETTPVSSAVNKAR